MASLLDLQATQLLKPVVALAGWTFVQETWIFEEDKVKHDKHTKIPLKVQRMTDNYNNLHEQPQVFYAIAVVLTLLGDQNDLTYRLAWSYTGMRIVHSLFHNLVNEPNGRFSLFVTSSVMLLALTGRAASLLFWK
ncbi:MAPEG family protein [Penicillium ucsense]|uniref:MAPEG family protein n=1 Tax=Penicillium ucsense TaxID=2839758 RepID=A0A8J8VW88_9EURO|nr:MAPEG family protein [Penicillium ucsense]KAF7730110.1 MAPEG family protein [Penicillium ucsense]